MIDYALLAEAQAYYRNLGYEPIEVPWMVSEFSSAVTRPADRRGCLVTPWGQQLVASGEQGFIELFPTLASGQYQTITPCFRDEPVEDELHRRYFMKLELINIYQGQYGGDYENDLQYMIAAARDFFLGSGMSDVGLQWTSDGYDLVNPEGVELGSYGMRTMPGGQTTWIYGTGLALPRFTSVLR